MRSAFRTYLLCVASFGLYGLYWVYRRARGVAGRDHHGALAWAAGSICAPIACLVLYELSRSASRSPRPTPLDWVPAALHGAIALVLLATPLHALWSPIWLCMPLPLCLVEARVSARHDAGGLDPAESRGLAARTLIAALAALGLALAGLATVRLDGPTAQLILAGRGPDAVQGIEAPYHLEPPERWRVVPSGTIGDGTADLEMATPDGLTWALVYVHAENESIDSIVDSRRSNIESFENLQSFEESRFLLEGEAEVPTSLSLYEVGGNAFARAEFRVLTADLGEEIVEVIGYTTDRPQELGELMQSFETLPPPPLDEATP